MSDNIQIEQVKIDNLIPYINNSRTHGPIQVAQVAASISEFGFTNPVLIDSKNGIIAGHGRVMAAQKLNLEQVPCIRLSGLSDIQKKAYIIADNQLALNAEWNLEALQLEVEALADADFDLDMLGFDDEFLKDLFDDEEDQDPYSDGETGSMAENFGQPPFSVLDTRKGDWIERKKQWRNKISDDGQSRESVLDGLDSLNTGGRNMPTVSLLDPVMAELMVSWFGKRDGLAFDPFAGDTIFGFVAGYLGMAFKGIELTGLNVVSSMHKKFKPSGVTSVWILEESHFTLHTYPEHKYLSVDCYTCGSEGNPDAAINMLVDSLHTTKTIRNRFKRG